MKLVVHSGKYSVIDRKKRIVILTKKLNTPSDIFTAYWIKNTDKVLHNCIELSKEATSFKQLKHYVAFYILHNKLDFSVPSSYVQSYERYIKLNNIKAVK